MSWRDLFQPTIKLLREGWVVRRPLNGAIRLMEDTGMFQRFSTLKWADCSLCFCIIILCSIIKLIKSWHIVLPSRNITSTQEYTSYHKHKCARCLVHCTTQCHLHNMKWISVSYYLILYNNFLVLGRLFFRCFNKSVLFSFITFHECWQRFSKIYIQSRVYKLIIWGTWPS